VSVEVLELFVEAFGRSDDKIAAVSESVLEVFGDDVFGLVVEVDHDISEEDAVVVFSGWFFDEVMTFVIDEFAEWSADLEEVSGGVDVVGGGCGPLDCLEVLLLEFFGDASEESLFVLGGAGLSEDLFADVGGIDFDIDTAKEFGLFEEADADGEWLLSGAAGSGPDFEFSGVRAALDAAAEVIEEVGLKPVELFFGAEEGGFVGGDGVEEEREFFGAGLCFEEQEVVVVAWELECAESSADAVAKECDAIFGDVDSAEFVDEFAEFVEFFRGEL
jgi:hypothetical protein